MSADIPASLDYKRHKLCFNKLWENTGMRYMPLSEGDVRTIVRADEWSFFSYRNLAMAACALKEGGLLLKCEHQETEKEVSRFYSYGLQLQLTEEWFYFSVQHESPVYSGYLLFKIRFTDEPFCIRVKFPDNHLPVGKYGNFFWLTMSGTDGKNTKYQNFWEEENAEIHMTQVFVPAGDVVTNDSTSATANAAEGGG